MKKEERIPSGSEVWLNGEFGHIVYPGGDKGFIANITVYPDGDVFSSELDEKTGLPKKIEGKLAEEARAFVEKERDKFQLFGIDEKGNAITCRAVEVKIKEGDSCQVSVLILARKKQLVISVFQSNGEEKIHRIPLMD